MPRKQSIESFNEIQKMLDEFAQEANEWVQFSERESPINAARFVQILVLGWLKKPNASLNELAQTAKSLGVEITGAALHERLNPRGLMLLAAVLQLGLERLKKACPLPLNGLGRFREIGITDSTQMVLPQALDGAFRGNKTNAMLKLQVRWDYLNGNVTALELEAGRNPDQNCQIHVHQAVAGGLELFDLGYFKQEYLRDIVAQGSFFVSRYQSQTALYDPQTGLRVDLNKVLNSVKGDEVQYEVLLGERVQLAVRLVARRLPKSEAQARRRKAKRKAQKQGKTCRSAYLQLLDWDILLTNLDATSTSLDQVFDLYRIRFQIEWVFRIWKSQLALDKGGMWRPERVMSYLYAHLIAALFIHLLTASWRWHQLEYSLVKCVQIVQASISKLIRCLARGGWGLKAWLRQLESDFHTFGRKSRRRKSPSTAQRIDNWGLS